MPATGQPHTLMTVQEAAEALRVTREFLYCRIRDGRCPAVRLGRRRLVPRAWVETLAEPFTARPPVSA